MAETKNIKLFNKFNLTLTKGDKPNEFKLEDAQKQIEVSEIWENIKKAFELPVRFNRLLPDDINIGQIRCLIEGDKINGIFIEIKAKSTDEILYSYSFRLSKVELSMKTGSIIKPNIVELQL